MKILSCRSLLSQSENSSSPLNLIQPCQTNTPSESLSGGEEEEEPQQKSVFSFAKPDIQRNSSTTLQKISNEEESQNKEIIDKILNNELEVNEDLKKSGEVELESKLCLTPVSRTSITPDVKTRNEMKLIPPIETDIVSKSNITADFFKELTTINEVMK